MTKTVLVLAANPQNTPPLRLDREIREIDNGLERARHEFTLKQKLAVRPVDVRRAMLDYRPNIVHFCGHGSGEEGIAFEDENGQAKLISANALASFFELFADKVECVVLNACYSEIQAEAIAQYISFVVGMKKAIGDSAAIEFAVAFYDALGAGKSVEFAYKLACNAMAWGSHSEHTIPALITKARTQNEVATNLVAKEHRLQALIQVKNEMQHYARSYSDAKVFANQPTSAPTEYLVKFRVPSFAPPLNEKSDPVRIDDHDVYFWFPPDFPLIAPQVFWQSPIFHPSIDPSTGQVYFGILQDRFLPGLSMERLCLMLREIAAFHNYPMDGPNLEAVKWLSSSRGQKAIVEMGGRRLHERIDSESPDFAPRMYELK